MPNAAPVSAAAAPEAPDFPADSRQVTVAPADYVAGGIRLLRFALRNPHPAVLHVRLTAGADWLSVVPTEVALGPKERQSVVVRADVTKAKAALRAGGPASGPIRLAYQRLYPASFGGATTLPETGDVFVVLPAASCPNCKRSLDEAIAAGDANHVPEFCPYCYERLRPCPVCGTLNSWLARRCLRDSEHILRAEPDWGMLGGGPAHRGTVTTPALPALARRWSYPTAPPLRREKALLWSAPASAYGIVAAAAATPDGDAHIFGFEAKNGATLWEPYPLEAPVYPDRGGVALSGGRLYAATIEGVCLALDAQRGTRLWERRLPGRVYGAVTPIGGDEPLLVATMAETPGEPGGVLFVLNSANGEILHRIPLPGPPDCAPAAADGRAFVHDDRGTLTIADLKTGVVLHALAHPETTFNAAPVVLGERVYSATASGNLVCRQVASGEEIWNLAVTNAPFAGTPAGDSTLIYLPADDGLHLVSAQGRSVRRYPTRQPVRSAPVVANGTLLFGCLDGSVYGAAAGRPLEKAYETATAGSQIVAAPAFADGLLFVAATNGVLYALAYERPQEADRGL
ncbi:MAG: PQQ-binding-like beta-propeller repeat protein [Capsulimonadales bacterium]|nr:PQQ-binding-like beta-propeller repeat protein [Capsulimonadales bacterium]